MKPEEFRKFIEAYNKHGKKSKKARGQNGKDIEDQTDWVWFDRKTLQELIDMTDAEKGGIKMYFGQYDKDTLSMIPEGRAKREEYIGRISLVLAPCNKTETDFEDVSLMKSSSDDDSNLKNGGYLCPPGCNP
ncbi:hypothetical protein [Fontibacter flavus]|uniref:Uncharacterized protein n=1 Tax=Fontibacter flavus TaxID=654838 RepID=A0ABV6FSC0_9BACT